MARSGDAADSDLVALAKFVVGRSTLGETLQQIVELAAASVGAARSVSLAMLGDGHVTTSASTDPADPDIEMPSAMSLSLGIENDTLGALTFYSDVEDGFSEQDVEAATAFAEQASVVLANAQAYADAQALNEQLEEALRSRATIEQAKGVLMAQSRVDPDTAFEMLRSASQRENRKLREIAAELVTRQYSGEPAP